jgi:hypothetical protein
MALTIRAHYDGKVFVPDEPVDLPINQALELEVKPVTVPDGELSLDERRAAFERVVARAIHGLKISDESLRRENIYEERL